MAELILGQTRRSGFVGQFVVFFAGSNPLDADTQSLFGWLEQRGIAFKTIDVLADPALLPLAESAAATPWLPMLSANGRLIGRGSLAALLRNPDELTAWLHAPLCRKSPQIWATEQAVTELAHQASGQSAALRLSISASMTHELSLEAAQDEDWVVAFNDVELALDVLSLARADGVVIRYVETDRVRGFSFDNPNDALGVRRIRCEQLQSWLASDDPPLLIDVRSEGEYLDARIAEARLFDAILVEAMTSLDRSTPLAFYCNNGVRSTSAARRYADLGFVNVVALEGGFQAWKREFNLEVLPETQQEF